MGAQILTVSQVVETILHLGHVLVEWKCCFTLAVQLPQPGISFGSQLVQLPTSMAVSMNQLASLMAVAHFSFFKPHPSKSSSKLVLTTMRCHAVVMRSRPNLVLMIRGCCLRIDTTGPSDVQKQSLITAHHCIQAALHRDSPSLALLGIELVWVKLVCDLGFFFFHQGHLLNKTGQQTCIGWQTDQVQIWHGASQFKGQQLV